jgi:hypothetical protein
MTDTIDAEVETAPRGGRGLRVGIFVAVCVLAVVIAAGALYAARQDRDRAVEQAAPVDVASAPPVLSGTEPVLLFESTALGDTFGKVASAALDDPDGARTVSDLRCEDRGVLTTYDALVFDSDLAVRHTIGLAGAPSRVRVSPGGSLAGVTVFVTGHSYANGDFSTQTTLIDLAQGSIVADLETDFTVLKDGDPWHVIDFNFWGVTFVDETRFYATLGTGGHTYLVSGDIAARQMVVVRDGVECPALSPDGTRIAFKQRSDGGSGPVTWRIAVLDLATSEVTVLAETRNVDDQVAWLDDDTVMYGLPNEESPAETDTWTVPADGSGVPRLHLPRAWSTVVTG